VRKFNSGILIVSGCELRAVVYDCDLAETRHISNNKGRRNRVEGWPCTRLFLAHCLLPLCHLETIEVRKECLIGVKTVKNLPSHCCHLLLMMCCRV